jgi:hypothetical protein
MKAFEYRVCQAQFSRVTYVNGEWNGHVANTSANAQKALESCPQMWDYLKHAGAEGWELVAVTTRTQEGGQIVDVLYLRRQC